MMLKLITNVRFSRLLVNSSCKFKPSNHICLKDITSFTSFGFSFSNSTAKQKANTSSVSVALPILIKKTSNILPIGVLQFSMQNVHASSTCIYDGADAFEMPIDTSPKKKNQQKITLNLTDANK